MSHKTKRRHHTSAKQKDKAKKLRDSKKLARATAYEKLHFPPDH